ncbi:indole-3-glycerol phosphate synthase TrpC [bacterium]|nr:indole-3-glycerol phosphate synthase TrpC [bacterium]
MTILDTIVQTKHEEVAQLIRQNPEWRTKITLHERSFRFAQALRQPGLNIIAEVKKASPSKGIIRSDFDPVEIAQSFKAAGASALSVLTDVAYFQGHPAFIAQIRAVVNLPILRKDFIIDDVQIYEASQIGADAILLIMAILTRESAQSLLNMAHRLGLDVLVEVHNRKEMEDALGLNGIEIIGINNRNLHTFETDIRLAETLTQEIRRFRPDVIVVAESGYQSTEPLVRLREAGANAVLIGEGLAINPQLLASWRDQG